jgi:hypothetical protein
VTRVELDNAVSAGIQWGSIGVGMVPTFEENSARLERGYTLEVWSKLDGMEKAMIIAIRRIGNAMQNLQTEAEIRANKRKMK